MTSFLQALNQHLEEKNLKAKYVQHILDEPHGKEPEYYGRFARMVRQYLPGVRTMDAIDADRFQALVTALKNVIDSSPAFSGDQA